MSKRASLGVLVVVLSFTSAARADEPSPAELFRQGQAEYRAERYRDAAELFEQAYSLAPKSQAAYNAAIAWQMAGLRARAANAFTRAVNLGELSTEELDETSRRLSQLVPTLGKLVLSAPKGAEARVGDERARVPGALYVEPGTHTLTVRLPSGKTEREELTLGAGETRNLDFEEEPVKPAVEKPMPAPVERDTTSSNTPRVLGWVAIGVGAAAIGTGVFLNVRGASENQTFEDSGRQNLGARESAIDLRTGAFVAYGVGAAFGALGAVLLLSSGGGESVAVGPGRVDYRVQF